MVEHGFSCPVCRWVRHDCTVRVRPKWKTIIGVFETQLLQFDPTPTDDPGTHPTNLRRRGYNHLALRVDDIGAATRHLVANGVRTLSDEMDYISRRLRFFEGPEGITLELVQWVSADTGVS